MKKEKLSVFTMITIGVLINVIIFPLGIYNLISNLTTYRKEMRDWIVTN